MYNNVVHAPRVIVINKPSNIIRFHFYFMLIIGGLTIQMCIENYDQPLSTYLNVILPEEEIENHGHVI